MQTFDEIGPDEDCCLRLRRHDDAVSVRFAGSNGEADMDIPGLDLHRVANGRITEVWLFGADQSAEDAFWGLAP